MGKHLEVLISERIKRSLRSRIFKGLVLATVLVVAPAFWWSLSDPVFSVPYSTVVFDRSGGLIGLRAASDEQLRFPPSDRLPEKYVKALVSYEDRRFFFHPGVDPIALGRAVFQNLRSGRVVSGGSTITMQAIRLSRGNPGRTYLEKLRESLLALRL